MTARHKRLTRADLESRLEQLTRSLLACFDEGLVHVDIAFQRSNVDMTMPNDPYRHYQPGPTVKLSITMHNPKDKREEEWLH